MCVCVYVYIYIHNIYIYIYIVCVCVCVCVCECVLQCNDGGFQNKKCSLIKSLQKPREYVNISRYEQAHSKANNTYLHIKYMYANIHTSNFGETITNVETQRNEHENPKKDSEPVKHLKRLS